MPLWIPSALHVCVCVCAQIPFGRNVLGDLLIGPLCYLAFHCQTEVALLMFF